MLLCCILPSEHLNGFSCCYLQLFFVFFLSTSQRENHMKVLLILCLDTLKELFFTPPNFFAWFLVGYFWSIQCCTNHECYCKNCVTFVKTNDTDTFMFTIQVVTLSVYFYFLAALMGAQWVDPKNPADYAATYNLPTFTYNRFVIIYFLTFSVGFWIPELNSKNSVVHCALVKFV